MDVYKEAKIGENKNVIFDWMEYFRFQYKTGGI